MPCDLDFGLVLGWIWGACWEHFRVKDLFKSDREKHQKNDGKKVTQAALGHAETGLWSPKRNQSDWLLATGNWQLADWLPADLLHIRNTPLVPRGHGGGFKWGRAGFIRLFGTGKAGRGRKMFSRPRVDPHSVRIRQWPRRFFREKFSI